MVTQVEEGTSACRITEQNDKDPIIEGDVIANLAFDPGRKYKFLVEGEFDLDNTGRTSPLDRQRVIQLVQTSGGEAVDKLDVDVDYVVLGESPKMPGADEMGQDPARLQAQREAYERYNRVKQEASKYSRTILNTNQLLDFLGFTPRKTLSR